MPQNVGYLTSNRKKDGDELFTPYYAVEPLIKYIPSDKVIWCPFDKRWSAFVTKLKENGNKIIATHLEDGYDFLHYEPKEHYDFIISNPP